MKVAIIGGGIAGMSLGFYLTKAGHCVTVYEKEKELGGLAKSFPLGDTFLERYYHHIFLTDTYTIELIEELGLKEKMIWQESKMAVYCEGKVYPFGTPFDLLRFKPLSFVDKIRFALSSLYLVRSEDFKKLETMTAEEVLLKTAGPNVYRKIWRPLLITKFGEEHYRDVVATWLHARVSSRGESKEGLFKREKLGYLDGSLKVLFDELEKRIEGGSGLIHKSSPVEKVDLNSDGKVVVASNNESEMFDKCCLCVPNPVILKIAGDLFSREYTTAHLESIKYRAVLCIILTISESLSPYYWINISEEGIPFTGLMEHTNLISKDKYSKNNIVYLVRYISPDERQYKMEEAELIDFYSRHIKDIFPKFDKSMIRQSFIFRDLYAEPIAVKGYSDRMPSAVSSIRNIFINNATLIRGMSPLIKKSFELYKVIDSHT